MEMDETTYLVVRFGHVHSCRAGVKIHVWLGISNQSAQQSLSGEAVVELRSAQLWAAKEGFELLLKITLVSV